MEGPVQDCFGPPPASLAPSVRVRRWDEALLLGTFCFAAAYLSIGGLLWRDWPFLGECPVLSFCAFLGTALHPLDVVHEEPELWIRALLTLGAGLICGSLGFLSGLRPHSRLKHVSGPRLLTGKEAVTAARIAASSDRGESPGFLCLHPALSLGRNRWSRHVFVMGSVGSGKTQIIMGILVQLFSLPRSARPKLFCVDVKGDLTGKFRDAVLISPWDARSRIWDIGRDLHNSAAASTFAQALIPIDGGNPFWPQAAQSVLIGAITSLQNERGQEWGWTEFGECVNASRERMAEVLAEHAPKAATLMGSEDSPTSMGVLSTLAAYTKVIDDLASAWGDEAGRKKVSLRDWVSDDYRGRGQLMVQAGPDAALSRSYIGAMVKLLEQMIISPAMPDSSERALMFVLDELPSLKLNVSGLIDKGRSKGAMVVAGLQSLAQLRGAMGQHEAQAVVGMLGTHVVCRVQMSEDRDQVAALFGRARVSVVGSKEAHEETRAVVEPSVLSNDLGLFHVGKKVSPFGFAIRALVAGVGPDVLLLEWPGIAPKDLRSSHVPARWTMASHKRVKTESVGPEVIKEALARAVDAWKDAAKTEQVRGAGTC